MKNDPKALTAAQVKDAGLALCLVCFLAGIWLKARWLEWAALGVLIIDMTWPPAFTWFAVAWFALSRAIGSVTSRLLLSVVFFGLVTPLGLVRRWMGKDPMALRKWRQDRASVFAVRDHRYTAGDIEKPF